MKGLIAASVYNDLPPEELRALNAHLDACPACRSESAGLQLFASRIPVAAPELDHDLWPAIRRDLRRSQRPSRPGLRLGWSTAFVFSTCLILVGGATYGVIRTHTFSDAPVIAGRSVPLENDLAAVAQMVEDHEYVAAYQRLDKAVRANAGSPLVGEAQLQLADLAYSRLNWYPEAFEAYDRIFREHPQLFSGRTECISRHELLHEARTFDYAPLYALDAARRAGDEAFAQLEAVVARYPDSLVAALAVEDMARQFVNEVPEGDAKRHVLAMERAQECCTNPVAVARLKLEIGHIYVHELNDASKARSFYADVATFENKSLAELAEGSLAALEDGPPSDVTVLPASAE